MCRPPSLRKSPQTIDSYTTGVRLFLAWCAEQGHAATIDRHLVARLGERPAGRRCSVRDRQMALKRFSAGLVEEDGRCGSL